MAPPWLVPLLMVFGGCSANVFFLECLIKREPGSGNLVTFAQFVFISLEGSFSLLFTRGFRSPSIPLSNFFIMVAIFFSVSVINNYALGFDIPLPLHMIFRSGSLITNMILGILINKKSYKLSKYLSVLLVTAGIIVCTLMSVKEKETTVKVEDASSADPVAGVTTFVVGIALLSLGLVMSSFLGLYQERLYTKYGSDWREIMFYSHFLGLPIFAIMWTDISNTIHAYTLSTEYMFGISVLWWFLLGNVVTQYFCIRGVFMMTTMVSSLTVTLALTLRKLFSLLLSIWYFSNPFTLGHWIGAAATFIGTLLFFDWQQSKATPAAEKAADPVTQKHQSKGKKTTTKKKKKLE